MNNVVQQSHAFPLVRANVRDVLTRSKAFNELPKEKRDELAHDMVKIASYIVGGETGDNTPTVAAFADNPPRPRGMFEQPAGDDFQASAAQQGGEALVDVVQGVDFPGFVAGLIDGVFNAIVDASIRQMEAYAELVKNVAKSVDQFMKDNVSENQARDYLADRYPDYIQVDLSGEQPRAQPREGIDENNMPDFLADLGMSVPIDTLDEDTTEEILVPAARRRMAMDRQQLLATMVLMGINRLIVTNGNISASVLFKLDTRDRISRKDTRASEYDRTSTGQYKSSGWRGWFRPYSSERTTTTNFKLTTVQDEESEASANLHVNLSGKVNINFKSETFPLERMADILVVNDIQQKAPAGMRTGGNNSANPAAANTGRGA